MTAYFPEPKKPEFYTHKCCKGGVICGQGEIYKIKTSWQWDFVTCPACLKRNKGGT